MRIFYLLIFFFMILSCRFAVSQTPGRPLSVDYKAVGIKDVSADLKAKTGYRIYYDPATTDTLKITVHVEQKTLNYILDQAFRNTAFHYAITDRGVFITRKYELTTEPASAYRDQQFAKQTVASTVTTYTGTDNDAVVQATSENKQYEIGIKPNTIQAGNATLAGYVRDIKTGEALVGASINAEDTKISVTTDAFGFFSLTLPKGKHALVIRALGMNDTRRQIIMYADGKLSIEMRELVTTLKEVKISAERIANVKSTEMGVNRLDIKSIKQVPAVFGEADILRVVLTLPGVVSVGEASTGFNVRGGSADQNLILLDDATIYNPAHFFGFFSAFNPDIVKDIQLYKSTIPEKFGGRLSSVLEVTNREGNKKQFTGSAGIGLLTSRFNIEGPIDSNRTSFIFGGRTTYSDWLLKLLPDEYKNSRASFTDLNLGISHQIDDKNNLYFSGYFSVDNFRLNSDTTYGYSNKTATIKWKHNYTNKLYSVLTAGYDRYSYNIESNANPINAYHLGFNINQTNLKADFNYYPNSNHTINFGISTIYYKLHPGDYEPDATKSLVTPNIVPAEQALESALYLGDKFDVTNNFSVSAGLRYSLYNYLGPSTVNNYLPGVPKTTSTLVDSTKYGSNKIIHTYHGPEIRVSARYAFTPDFSVKAAYNTLRQYIHLLSNTTAIAPTDIWKLSDPNIKPQYGDQISFGIFKNLNSNSIETSVEVYYKRLNDYLDYKSGATLVLNHHIETDVINTTGKAYGIEFFLRKNTGALNGWISYTYSRTFLRMNDPTIGNPVNGGNYYPANYDKPHDFNFTGNYRLTHRYSVSLNVTYSTGRPITLPTAKYYYLGSERVLYSDRNAYRIPDYFRSDFSINIDGNHKIHQRTHNSWTVGVYNLTGRQNAYSTYFTEDKGAINGYKLSIFAIPIPFINYNIRF